MAFHNIIVASKSFMREGLQWKAHSHEVRVARTWNAKPDPPQRGMPKTKPC